LALFGRIAGFVALSVLDTHMLWLHVWFRLYCVFVVIFGMCLSGFDPVEW
jgi:hypothetical protein